MHFHLDNSLEKFLDGEGLDDPAGDHRLSADAYVAWGCRRSEAVLVYNTSNMSFKGRDETIGTVLDHFCDSIMKPPEKNHIFFVHASPGVGKTRLFLEMVKMNVEDRKPNILYVGKREEKRALIDNFIHIAVSFNGSTTYRDLDSIITGMKDCLSQVVIRILHIWLTTGGGLSELSKKITAALRSGTLPPDEFNLSKVLSLVSRRSGRKHVILLIDEILKVTDDSIKDEIVLALASEQDIKDYSYTLRVLFSSLKVDIFAKAKTYSGRPISSVSLPLLKRKDTQSLALEAAERAIDVFLDGKSLGTKSQLVGIMTMLSGGHMRAMEHLCTTLENLENSDSVLFYISHACRTYKLETKDIYGAILLSLLGQPVPLDTRVRLKTTSVTVEDMVANGLLVDSITAEYTDITVLPNMPLLSLIRWAFIVNEKFVKEKRANLGRISEDQYPGLHIAKLITKLVETAVTSGPITGKIFESVCIIRHLVMRHVYKSLMEDNIIDNPTKVDWRRATLKDYFKYIRREGPISAELASLTFDFTKPLTWEQLDNNVTIKKFFDKNYTEKCSSIGQPMVVNFKASDYFICLVSNCGVVITIVVQTKFSSETSDSEVYVGGIEKVLEKAKNMVAEKFGVPKNTILCVAELWREGPGSGTIDTPMKLENAFMQTKSELEEQVGPLMRDMIALGDLKNIYV